MSDQLSKMLFLFFAIACTALRVFLKLTAVDPSTGFYEGGGIAVPVFLALLVLAVIALLLLRFRRTPPAVLQVGLCSRLPSPASPAGSFPPSTFWTASPTWISPAAY